MSPEMGHVPSPTRLGYLDELAPSHIPADIDLLKLKEPSKTILGAIEDLITCADDADPTGIGPQTRCTPDIPAGAVVTAAYIIVLCRTIEDGSDAANYVGTAGVVQVKKVTNGTWTTGIAIPAGAWDVGASAYGAGFAIVGETDVKAQVADGSQVQFQIVTLRALASDIFLHDVQFGLKIYYRM